MIFTIIISAVVGYVLWEIIELEKMKHRHKYARKVCDERRRGDALSVAYVAGIVAGTAPTNKLFRENVEEFEELVRKMRVEEVSGGKS